MFGGGKMVELVEIVFLICQRPVMESGNVQQQMDNLPSHMYKAVTIHPVEEEVDHQLGEVVEIKEDLQVALTEEDMDPVLGDQTEVEMEIMEIIEEVDMDSGEETATITIITTMKMKKSLAMEINLTTVQITTI
jgi:hypothetical protein